MKIHRENLLIALDVAIEDRRKFEREKMNYTSDSGLVAGWVEALEAVKRGEALEFIQ